MNRLNRVKLVTAMTILFVGACGNETGPPPPSDKEASPGPAIPEAPPSSVQLVTEAIRVAEILDPLNALITLDREGALARAEAMDDLRSRGQVLGPLHGMPIVAKDNIHVAGLPNTAGTPGLKNFVPDADSPVVAALRDAGAIMVAKTNMHELAFGITSDNAAFGAVGNPAAPGFIVGGSSGGTAAAIAAGMVRAGLGTDTGGSTRIPAAHAGIVGYRPSSGRYAQAGVTPISSTTRHDRGHGGAGGGHRPAGLRHRWGNSAVARGAVTRVENRSRS